MSNLSSHGIAAIVSNPQESFSVELKTWIDPARCEDRAKIAKACLALYNNNGGLLVIGFNDDGTVDMGGIPLDIRATFHVDIVQEIVAKHASEPFGIEVEFIEREGIEHPVVVIPSGVKSPAACKSPLPQDGTLLKCHAVYVRTLRSNNRISSSEATYKDWSQIVEKCFDNREANIGAFVRRHLSTDNLRDALAAFIGVSIDDMRKPVESEFLNFGRTRFDEQWKDRNSEPFPDIGTMEIAAIANGPSTPSELSLEALWRINSVIPRISGWPPWAIIMNHPDDPMYPYVFKGGWEALMAGGVFGPHLDFWRMEAVGKLYHFRALEDDMTVSANAPKPRTSLDFYLQIVRVAEFVAVAIRIIRSLGFEPDGTTLSIAFRWTHLKGRRLTSWASPRHAPLRTTGVCHEDEVMTSASVPLSTPDSALAPHVDTLVAPLFALFGGFRMEQRGFELIINEFFNR